MKKVVIFFILAYIISWVIWLPLYGHHLGLSQLPILPFHHALGGLGPLLAAFITSFFFHGWEGVVELGKKCVQTRPFSYLAIALFSPFIVILVASIISYFSGGQTMELSGMLINKEFPEFGFFTIFLYNLIFFGFGEEVGWRGFALPYFQTKFNALTSAIIISLFWALWHWPLFLYRSGYTSMEVADILGWTLSLLTGSILLTWLFNASKGSILICAVFHATVDIAFTADMSDERLMNFMGFIITLWGIITVIIFKPKTLAPKP